MEQDYTTRIGKYLPGVNNQYKERKKTRYKSINFMVTQSPPVGKQKSKTVGRSTTGPQSQGKNECVGIQRPSSDKVGVTKDLSLTNEPMVTQSYFKPKIRGFIHTPVNRWNQNKRRQNIECLGRFLTYVISLRGSRTKKSFKNFSLNTTYFRTPFLLQCLTLETKRRG